VGNFHDAIAASSYSYDDDDIVGMSQITKDTYKRSGEKADSDLDTILTTPLDIMTASF
jgi:hypothetical protein